MTYRAAKRLFERLARDCGFAVRPHMFRHTAATSWVRAGTDLDVVRALLGHVSLASTTVYLNPQVLHRAGEVCVVCLARRVGNAVGAAAGTAL
jgi:site-specific recombinase XerD